MGTSAFLQLQPYSPPSYARHLGLVPKHKYKLGLLPTPLHRWRPPGVPADVEMWIKRDDLSGMQLSGNKVRKLEFLMAAAKEAGHDSVITLGGIQSNHCRATAVAARYLGLDCHLVLRTSQALVGQEPGLVTKEEYTRFGSPALGDRLLSQLRSKGLNPYLIPVGGSSPLGTWGYLQAVAEIEEQAQEQGIVFDDVVMACGSGGTAAGLALGLHLSPSSKAKLHAYAVCDDPAYFYDYIDGLLRELGATADVVGADARGLLNVVQAKGAGYAISQEEELQIIQSTALETGVILDPVYSGKALHMLLQDMRRDSASWAGRKVLFVHTGGLLGMYDKLDQLGPLTASLDRVHRLQL